MAQGPRYIKTLLSGKIFQGLRGYLPKDGHGPAFSVFKLQGLNNPSLLHYPLLHSYPAAYSQNNSPPNFFTRAPKSALPIVFLISVHGNFILVAQATDLRVIIDFSPPTSQIQLFRQSCWFYLQSISNFFLLPSTTSTLVRTSTIPLWMSPITSKLSSLFLPVTPTISTRQPDDPLKS